MSKRQKEITGLVLIILSFLMIVSLFGYDISERPENISNEFAINTPLSYFGVYSSFMLFSLLGYPSIILPIIVMIIGYIMFSGKSIKNYSREIVYTLISGIWVSTFIAFIAGFNDLCPGCQGSEFNSLYNQAGIIGMNFYIQLRHFLGFYGSFIFMFVSMLIIVTSLFQLSIYEIFNNIILLIKSFIKIIKNIYLFLREKIKNFKKKDNIINTDNSFKDNIKIDNNDELDINNKIEDEPLINDDKKSEEDSIETVDETEDEEQTTDKVMVEEEENVEEGNLNSEHNSNHKYFNYKLPSTDYLNDPIEIIRQNEDELMDKGKQLKYAINTFGVDGEVVKISPGPIISLFEVEPAEGVRVNKFINLSDDLARVMKAQRVRIIAPIPGSRSVGIELPNENLSIVYLKNILNSTKYIESKSKLTIALGKTTSGDAYIFDLCKMPHLLVAGATGSGKSVCINTIILSILYKAKPDEVKFILLDPKKIELSTYNSLVGYHLVTAPNLDEYVMTTSENAVGILNSAISEMEKRFQIFSDTRVRNIEEYHNKQKNNSSLENIPYIVVIIDELADLMMTSGRAVEEPITRLAQKARAVGIHLVVATQRPSVDVITGLIKSNFPSRISFLVSSKVDSRTILDQMGAEKLLGNGDMLFLLPGSSSPIRLHNAYVTLEEIEKIMNHISTQPKPNEIQLPEVKAKSEDIDFNINNQDEYLKDAAELVINHQQASVSLLQRKFRIGYSRAGRIIDELESLGIVGSYSGSKAREVLVDYSYLKEIFNE